MSVQGADESSWKSSCCLCVSFAVSFCVAVVLCQPVGLCNRVDFGLTAFCNFFPAECDICVWFDRPLVDWVSCQPGSWHGWRQLLTVCANGVNSAEIDDDPWPQPPRPGRYWMTHAVPDAPPTSLSAAWCFHGSSFASRVNAWPALERRWIPISCKTAVWYGIVQNR